MRYNSLAPFLSLLWLIVVSWNAALVAQRSQPVTRDYTTIGNPTSALETPDGKYLFVSVTNVNVPNFTGSDAAAGARRNVISGIQVFRSRHGELSPLGFVRVGGTGANGLVLLTGGKTRVVGAGDAGVAFLDVDAILRGDAVPIFADQGLTAGTFDVVASRDGRYILCKRVWCRRWSAR